SIRGAVRWPTELAPNESSRSGRPSTTEMRDTNGGCHMNTQPILSAAILMAAFGVVPVSTIADQRAATTSVSSVADVALSDVNLSSPACMLVAGGRLRT